MYDTDRAETGCWLCCYSPISYSHVFKCGLEHVHSALVPAWVTPSCNSAGLYIEWPNFNMVSVEKRICHFCSTKQFRKYIICRESKNNCSLDFAYSFSMLNPFNFLFVLGGRTRWFPFLKLFLIRDDKIKF